MNGKEVPDSKELHKNNVQYLASHWIWGLKEENESKLTWKSKPKGQYRGGWELASWCVDEWTTVEKNRQ